MILVILILLVALFVFSAIVRSRGDGKGLSPGGCLPTEPDERSALQERWFSPGEVRREDMTFTCPLVGRVLEVKGVCAIGIAPTGPVPVSVWQKIRAGFKDRPRGLMVAAPAGSPIEISLRDHAEGSRPIDATVDKRKSTNLTISRAGADLSVSCAQCQVTLFKPGS